MRNIDPHITQVRNLRERHSKGVGTGAPARGDSFSSGLPRLDDHLGGGLSAKAVHEIFAADASQAQVADGFALGMALRLKPSGVVWGIQTRAFGETGVPYGPGIEDWGLDVTKLVLVRVKDAAELLLVGEEALASGAAEAVILSAWGEAPAMTLTASRRLALAAARGQATGFFVRAAARPTPSAAETRWRVRAAPSMPLEAGAPGRPALAVELLRSRSGALPGEWIVEWDREACAFAQPAVFGGVVSLPADRTVGASAGIRRAA